MFFPAADNAPEPRATPLYAATAALSTTNSWTSINGRAAARAFTAVEDEYRTISDAAAIFDLGPLSRYTLRGPDAATVLARLTTTPVAELGVGDSARGLILDADGYVADYADVTRLAGDLFLLTTSAPIDRRLQLAIRRFGVEALNIDSMVSALGLVGPAARGVASQAGIDLLSADASAQARVRGVELAIRSLLFGSIAGVEIIYPAEDALVIWERIQRKKPLPAAGLDALEILRIEGGCPRLGVDFHSADHGPGAARRRPAEIGLPHLAPPHRAWFNGRSAMIAAGPETSRLVVLAIESEIVSAGSVILARGEAVGRVTSAAFSPRLRRAVAFAEIPVAAFGRPLEAALSGGRAPATILETPEGRLCAAFMKSRSAATESAG